TVPLARRECVEDESARHSLGLWVTGLQRKAGDLIQVAANRFHAIRNPIVGLLENMAVIQVSGDLNRDLVCILREAEASVPPLTAATLQSPCAPQTPSPPRASP